MCPVSRLVSRGRQGIILCLTICFEYTYTDSMREKTVLSPRSAIEVGQIISGREVVARLGSERNLYPKSVVGRSHRRSGQAVWLMRCLTCGREHRSLAGNLRRGSGCMCVGRVRKIKNPTKPKSSTEMRQWSVRAKKINNRTKRRIDRNLYTPVKGKEYKILWEDYNGCCAFCSAPLCLSPGRFNSVQWEHTTPISRGGAHSKDNLVPACRDCNAMKGSLTKEEFFLALDGKFCTIFGLFRVLSNKACEVTSINPITGDPGAEIPPPGPRVPF